MGNVMKRKGERHALMYPCPINPNILMSTKGTKNITYLDVTEKCIETGYFRNTHNLLNAFRKIASYDVTETYNENLFNMKTSHVPEKVACPYMAPEVWGTNKGQKN